MDATRVRVEAVADRVEQLADDVDRLTWETIEAAVVADSLDALAFDAGDGYSRADCLWRARSLMAEATRCMRVATTT